MKMRMPWLIVALAAMAVIWGLERAFAFNLWRDIETETQWTLGSSVAAGTAVALKNEDSLNIRGGQFIGSALAQISNYRMLSVWAGGNFIPRGDNGLRAVDTGKIGLNLGYFFKNFVNQPPDLIKNLVIGPSLSTSIWTTPHVFVPFVDCNFAFGGMPQPQKTTPQPSPIPPTSRLNLNWRPT